MFAFVEMQTEALASTMLRFHGLEVAGRPMKIGRPAGYLDPPHGPVPPLDVPMEVLKELGISGQVGPARVDALGQHIDARKRRELYVGNLTAGAVSGVMLRDHVTRVLAGALGGDGGGNPIVRNAEIQAGGMFAFVEFRTSRRRRWLWRSSTATTCAGGRCASAGPRATRTWGARPRHRRPRRSARRPTCLRRPLRKWRRGRRRPSTRSVEEPELLG